MPDSNIIERVRVLKEKAKKLKLSKIIFKLYDGFSENVWVGKKLVSCESKYYVENAPIKIELDESSSQYLEGFTNCKRVKINKNQFDFYIKTSHSYDDHTKEYGTLRLLVNGKKVYESGLSGTRKEWGTTWDPQDEPDSFIDGDWVGDINAMYINIINELSSEKLRLAKENEDYLKNEFGL